MKSLEEIVAEIRGKEREIINQFAKAFLAANSIITETNLAWLITHIQLNRKDTKEGYCYWFSFKENE